ncbi:hypothetical protein AB9F26_05940 [Falsihalocynthiibacter sp. BN13B15]|uniref:hypothetical protein n=1 Tax=Falsihalocynthiibacter sp. BN13B15 TaxID=3240871 RepID=UPI00350EE0ED
MRKKPVFIATYFGAPYTKLGLANVAAFGSFRGLERFDRIKGLYQNRDDPKFLNADFIGSSADDWTLVLKEDVFKLEPSFANHFPE